MAIHRTPMFLGGLAAIVLAGGVAAAPDNRFDLPGGLDGAGSRLNLTTAQRDQIREIALRHKAEGLAEATVRARDARRGARRAMRDPDANESNVREAWRHAGAAWEDLAVLRHAMRAEVFSVLTPEQRERVERRRKD